MRRYTIKKDAPTHTSSIDYNKDLNPQQRAVVQAASGPMLVIAGAGSGKTHTLTYRVAHLISRGVHPSKILLLTFTNKAARSMGDRVKALIDVPLQDLWSGTFHSVANRILRTEASQLNYRQDFTILDTEDASTLMSACVAGAGVDHTEQRFPRGRKLQHIYSHCANTQSSLEQALAARYPYFKHLVEPIRAVLQLYQSRKLEMSLMDFDDLLLNWKRLLTEHPEAHTHYARKFEYLLVDEYQDTNHIQGEIIDLMASHHRNLMVVGDDAQSIYAFRGADYRNILEFQARYPDAQRFMLEINYRSTPQILSLANASIRFNQAQHPKTLRAHRPPGLLPALVKLRDVQQQAEFICQRILELADEGLPLDEVAVLYRAHHHAMELQLEMTRRNIPFVVRSGLRFFEQAHIKDVLAYLKFLFNPRDELSFLRLSQQWRGIGGKRSQSIWNLARDHQDPLEAVTSREIIDQLPRRAARSWRDASALIDRLRRDRLSSPPSELVQHILEGGYADYAERAFDEPSNRLDDLEQLAHYADQFGDLDHFLGEIALLSGMSGQEILVGGEVPDEYVTLSSIHQAKGLEWSAVFCLWLAHGHFPSSRAETQPDLEEERRLFYVMSTRARDELYLCHPLMSAGRRGRQTVLRESEFIEELRYDDTLDQVPWEQWLVDAGA